jgi:hypothetical protein
MYCISVDMTRILDAGLRSNKSQNGCKLNNVGLTRKNMVKAAREAGFGDVSERLVTDWASKGLLDRPHRTQRGKGNGRGAFYEWPETQRDLFLTLLSKRPEVKGVTTLCQIPVGVWLYWGDQWVPLRQVRLALPTWWSTAGRTGWDRSLSIARQVVDTMAPSDMPRKAKAELRELVAGALDGGVFPRDLISSTIQAAFNHKSPAGTYGPFEQRATQVVDGMWSMVVAMQHYDELTDGMFLEAKARLEPIILNYVQQWPVLSQDPIYGPTYEQPTREFFINRSCSQLLIGLGLQILANADGRSLGPVNLRPSKPLNKALEGLPLR